MQPTDHRSTGLVAVRTCGSIVLVREHDFWRAVPSRGDVLGHELLGAGSNRISICIKPAREAKVADLQLAVRVHQQIAGLQIAVEDIRTVDVLEATKRLVDKTLEVRIAQGLSRADDRMQVRLHELLVEVHLVERLRIRNIEVIQAGDVLVAAEMTQEPERSVWYVLDFTQCALRQNALREHIRDALDRDALARCTVHGGGHASVRALAKALGDAVRRVYPEDLREDLGLHPVGRLRFAAHDGRAAKLADVRARSRTRAAPGLRARIRPNRVRAARVPTLLVAIGMARQRDAVGGQRGLAAARTSPPLSATVRAMRRNWKYAAICQFLITFDEALQLDGFQTQVCVFAHAASRGRVRPHGYRGALAPLF